MKKLISLYTLLYINSKYCVICIHFHICIHKVKYVVMPSECLLTCSITLTTLDSVSDQH